MEFAPAQLRTFGPANLLGVPGLGPALSSLDSDDEDCDVVIGIRPKSSPLPRRKTSTSDDESEGVQQQQQQTASSQGSRRRVCFADTKGLRLTLVKEFDSCDVPELQKEAKGHYAERYSYHLTFPSPVPVPPGELGARVREQKIELESIGLLPGTTVLKGLVRVLNVSFDKTVFVRTTLDAWASHFDLLAEYVRGSGDDGVTDCFSFKLTLVPPFDERGARVDFCLRYETPVGTFWANNDTKNYVLFCHQRAKEEGPSRQEGCVRRKSCLKATRQHFITVDNSSLEENVQSIEIGKIQKAITGVSKNGDALSVKSRPVTDSRSATSEEERHKLATESRRNASRRSERRAARQARVNDLFAQRDHGPEREKGDSSCEASLPETPSDRPREGGLNPVVDSTLDSLSPPSGGSSAADQRHASPAQSRGSSEAEKYENVNSVDPDVLLDRAEVGEMTAATQARQAPHLEEELEQKPHSAAASITGDNGKRPLESMGQSHRGSDHVCIVNNTGDESHSIDVSLAESTEAPVSAVPGSFTFGTVRAPLYPLVCGQVKSENRRINQSENRLNPIRGRSMMGDSLENLTGNDGGTSRISRGPLDSHERKPMNIHLNDVPGEDGQSRVSVATDSSTNHADLDGQEPEHRCTGTPGHSQPATDTTPLDVNSEVLRACTTRVESLNIQGKAVEGKQENPTEKQILADADADAAKAQAEAEEVASDIHTHLLDPTQALSQPRVLQGATDATPHTPHIKCPFVLPCENQDMDQQICCDAATALICTDAPNAQDGFQPTMTMSTTHIHPEQARGGIEPLERLNPTCLMCSDVDQSIPELEDGHGCSAADLSQETLEVTSLEVFEEAINGGNESTNRLEEGDMLTPTVEQEDIGDVSVCVKVKRKSCAHPDMLGKDFELALVEKPVCKPTQREGSAFEDAATEQDYFGPCEVRSERKNWEMMVEEEEEDALGEEVMRKEVAENGEKEMDALREEQAIAEQQTLEEMVGCEKREHTETEFKERKHFCVTEGQSKIEVETVEEPLVWEEKKVEEEEEVRKYADHGADNHRDICEEIRDEEKETLAETDGETQVQVEDEAERISVDQEERSVSGAGVGGMAVEAVEEEIVFGTTKEEMNEEPEKPETRAHTSQNKAEINPSITPMSSVHEGEVERVTDKENSPENETTYEINLISGEEGPSNTYSSHLTNGQSKTLSESAATCGSDSSTVEKGSLVLTAEPECDPMGEGEGEEEVEGEGDTSSESASDEEMELYLHRLRAAPRPQNLRSFTRDGASGKGSQTGKRPSIDRAKLLPSSMPPISEAEHEEQLTSSPDTPEEMDVENFQAESTPFPTQGNQEWTDAFSSSHILKSALYVTMFLVFVVVAYHYDFLACFSLYLLSILWLYCQSDTQPVTNNNGLTTR